MSTTSRNTSSFISQFKDMVRTYPTPLSLFFAPKLSRGKTVGQNILSLESKARILLAVSKNLRDTFCSCFPAEAEEVKQAFLKYIAFCIELCEAVLTDDLNEISKKHTEKRDKNKWKLENALEQFDYKIVVFLDGLTAALALNAHTQKSVIRILNDVIAAADEKDEKLLLQRIKMRLQKSKKINELDCIYSTKINDILNFYLVATIIEDHYVDKQPLFFEEQKDVELAQKTEGATKEKEEKEEKKREEKAKKSTKEKPENTQISAISNEEVHAAIKIDDELFFNKQYQHKKVKKTFLEVLAVETTFLYRLDHISKELLVIKKLGITKQEKKQIDELLIKLKAILALQEEFYKIVFYHLENKFEELLVDIDIIPSETIREFLRSKGAMLTQDRKFFIEMHGPYTPLCLEGVDTANANAINCFLSIYGVKIFREQVETIPGVIKSLPEMDALLKRNKAKCEAQKENFPVIRDGTIQYDLSLFFSNLGTRRLLPVEELIANLELDHSNMLGDVKETYKHIRYIPTLYNLINSLKGDGYIRPVGLVTLWEKLRSDADYSLAKILVRPEYYSRLNKAFLPFLEKRKNAIMKMNFFKELYFILNPKRGVPLTLKDLMPLQSYFGKSNPLGLEKAVRKAVKNAFRLEESLPAAKIKHIITALMPIFEQMHSELEGWLKEFQHSSDIIYILLDIPQIQEKLKGCNTLAALNKADIDSLPPFWQEVFMDANSALVKFFAKKKELLVQGSRDVPDEVVQAITSCSDPKIDPRIILKQEEHNAAHKSMATLSQQDLFNKIKKELDSRLKTQQESIISINMHEIAVEVLKFILEEEFYRKIVFLMRNKGPFLQVYQENIITHKERIINAAFKKFSDLLVFLAEHLKSEASMLLLIDNFCRNAAKIMYEDVAQKISQQIKKIEQEINQSRDELILRNTITEEFNVLLKEKKEQGMQVVNMQEIGAEVLRIIVKRELHKIIIILTEDQSGFLKECKEHVLENEEAIIQAGFTKLQKLPVLLKCQQENEEVAYVDGIVDKNNTPFNLFCDETAKILVGEVEEELYKNIKKIEQEQIFAMRRAVAEALLKKEIDRQISLIQSNEIFHEKFLAILKENSAAICRVILEKLLFSRTDDSHFLSAYIKAMLEVPKYLIATLAQNVTEELISARDLLSYPFCAELKKSKGEDIVLNAASFKHCLEEQCDDYERHYKSYFRTVNKHCSISELFNLAKHKPDPLPYQRIKEKIIVLTNNKNGSAHKIKNIIPQTPLGPKQFEGHPDPNAPLQICPTPVSIGSFGAKTDFQTLVAVIEEVVPKEYSVVKDVPLVDANPKMVKVYDEKTLVFTGESLAGESALTTHRHKAEDVATAVAIMAKAVPQACRATVKIAIQADPSELPSLMRQYVQAAFQQNLFPRVVVNGDVLERDELYRQLNEIDSTLADNYQKMREAQEKLESRARKQSKTPQEGSVHLRPAGLEPIKCSGNSSGFLTPKQPKSERTRSRRPIPFNLSLTSSP